MGKFDGWLLCSDFDGTIYLNKTISDKNSAAIKYFQENGGRFTFASGRFPPMFADLAACITPRAPIAGLNGATIESPDGGSVFYRGGMERDAAMRFAFDSFELYPSVGSVLFYYYDRSVTVHRGETIDGELEREMAELPDPLPKIVLRSTPEDSSAVFADVERRAAGRYSISRSWVRGIELNDPADTKGAAVLRIKEIVGARHLVCVGDYENDISMIRAADIGYAVGSAVPALKAVADRITVDAADHAIAAIVADIEAQIDRGEY